MWLGEQSYNSLVNACEWAGKQWSSLNSLVVKGKQLPTMSRLPLTTSSFLVQMLFQKLFPIHIFTLSLEASVCEENCYHSGIGVGLDTSNNHLTEEQLLCCCCESHGSSSQQCEWRWCLRCNDTRSNLTVVLLLYFESNSSSQQCEWQCAWREPLYFSPSLTLYSFHRGLTRTTTTIHHRRTAV